MVARLGLGMIALRTLTTVTAVLGATLLSGCAADSERGGTDDNLSSVAQELTCVNISRTGSPITVSDALIVGNPLDPTKQNANYGTLSSFTAGTLGVATLGSLVRFDLATVPAGATITSATLSLRKAVSLGNGTVSFYRVTAPWSENTVTWSSFSNAFDASQTVASFDAGSIPDGSPTQIDVLPVVQSWYSGALPNYGFYLSQPTGRTQFGSSEASFGSRPTLQVCYAPGTCSDGVQNGTETGIDCGGLCAPCQDLCIGVVCQPSDACHIAGACNPQTGACSNPIAPFGTACDDGDACTLGDSCSAGLCLPTSAVTCAASDQCHAAGTCDSSTGVCSNPPLPDATPCNDGDACTQTDSCQAGVCVGQNPVVCPASDQCHGEGVCNSVTGACSNPALPDGTLCNDGSLCATNDACQAGICVGTPVVCAASDSCHLAGVCDLATGQCSNPLAPEGSACSDGNSCSGGDACIVGACTGSTAPRAALTGAQVVGGGDPDGTGTANLTLNLATNQICWTLSWANIVNPNAARIHVGAPGVNGPVFVSLSATPSGCVFTSSVNAFQLATSASAFYINLSNSAYPGGALRGQLTTSLVDATPCDDANACTSGETCESGLCKGSSAPTATMNGAQEVGGGDPDGTGTAAITLNSATNQVCWTLSWTNIGAPTGAHIHTGAVGVSGPIFIGLNPTPSGCVSTTAANIQAVRANPSGFYVNLHDASFPAGAIRGQLTNAVFDGSACDDGDVCTTPDLCSAGVCLSGADTCG